MKLLDRPKHYAKEVSKVGYVIGRHGFSRGLHRMSFFVPPGTFFNNVLTASYLRDHGNSFSSKAAAIVMWWN